MGDDYYDGSYRNGGWLERRFEKILSNIQKLEMAGVDVTHLYEEYWYLYNMGYEPKDSLEDTLIFVGMVGIIIGVQSRAYIWAFLGGLLIALVVFVIPRRPPKKNSFLGRLKNLQNMTEKTLELYYSGQIKGKDEPPDLI